MRKKISCSTLAILIASSLAFAEDTIGKVTKVMVKPSSAPGKSVVRVYLAPISGGNDRFGCFTGQQPQGYIETSDNNPGMNLTTLNHFLAVALAAKSTGGTFAADHESGTSNNCNNASWAYVSD